MTPRTATCWVLWHPKKGFGVYIDASTYLSDAVADREARMIIDDDDEAWKVCRAVIKITDSDGETAK